MPENIRKLLITGANGGMGRVTADLALAENYDLVLVDLPSTDLTGLQQRYAQAGVQVSCYPLDVTNAEMVDNLVSEIESLGGIDAVIHTVGVSPNMADWQRIIDIDLISTARFLEAVRPGLKVGGAAVGISSSSAYMAPANTELEALLADPLNNDIFAGLAAMPENPMLHPGLAYSYSKRALQHFIARQAAAWGSEGKRLVSLSPGLINTEMGQKEYEATENFSRMLQQVALGKLGQPENIANTALFLVSEKAAYISGCDILVDGGLIAGFRQMQRKG